MRTSSTRSVQSSGSEPVISSKMSASAGTRAQSSPRRRHPALPVMARAPSGRLLAERLDEKEAVERDDDRRDDPGGGGRDRAVDHLAHDVLAAREQDERDQRERDAEAQDDLAEDQRAARVQPDGEDEQRGDHRDAPAQDERDLPVDE